MEAGTNLDVKKWNALTVVKLREVLKKHSLCVAGVKSALIQRLVDAKIDPDLPDDPPKKEASELKSTPAPVNDSSKEQDPVTDQATRASRSSTRAAVTSRRSLDPKSEPKSKSAPKRQRTSLNTSDTEPKDSSHNHEEHKPEVFHVTAEPEAPENIEKSFPDKKPSHVVLEQPSDSKPVDPKEVKADYKQVKVDPKEMEVDPKEVKVDPKEVKADYKQVKADEKKEAQIKDTKSSTGATPSLESSVEKVNYDNQKVSEVVEDATKNDGQSSTLVIRNFTRPITLDTVRDALKVHGEVISFWMNKIRTHCFVTFATFEQAEKARSVFDGLKFPQDIGKNLSCKFIDREEADRQIKETEQCQPAGRVPVAPPPYVGGSFFHTANISTPVGHQACQRALSRETPNTEVDSQYTIQPLPSNIRPNTSIFKRTEVSPKIYYAPNSSVKERSGSLKKSYEGSSSPRSSSCRSYSDSKSSVSSSQDRSISSQKA